MGKSPFDSVTLLQKRERNWGSVICDRTMNDPQGTICTRVKEISNEYQEDTFISKKRTFYENNSAVSDGPQRKNAKQVAGKKKSKKGESGVENPSISKEISRKKKHLCIKPKLLRQQDLSMVWLIVVIWKLKFLMN